MELATQRGPAEADITIAVAELDKELASPELVDPINPNINVVPLERVDSSPFWTESSDKS